VNNAQVEHSYRVAKAANAPGIVATDFQKDMLEKVSDVWKTA
jgi:hypothetical protein